MINILKSKDCKLTISNQKESIQIDAMPMRKELKSLLIRLHHKGHLNYHPCIGIKENNVEWHKIKFFMGMLDFFLLHYQSDKLQNKRKRKDWLLYSQSLYLIGYLEDEKYLKGYILKKQEIVNLDGANSVKTHIMPLTGLGKFLTDNTKNINDTAIRSKSIYSF